MPITARFTRLAVPLLAAASLTAAPTASAAGLPLMQQATFAVSATFSQQTRWEREPLGSISDCMPVLVFSGEGGEHVTGALKPWRFTAYRTGGQLGFVPARGRSGLGATITMRIDRQGVERTEEVANTCAGDPGSVTDSGPYDCGTRHPPMAVTLVWRRGRLALGVKEGLLAPLGGEYRNCPIHVHGKVRAAGLTTITQALPLNDLFDPNLRQHVVVARRTFTLARDGYRGRTTVRWEVKLTRKGAIRG